MAKKSIKVSIYEKIFDIFNNIIMALFLILCLYPFYYVVIYSISDATAQIRGVYLLPSNINFSTYINIFAKGEIENAFIVSTVRTVLATCLCVFFSSMFAFLLTEKKMLFRKIIYRYVIITMYLNAGLIPWYITLKTYGLRNNFLVYIIPGIISAYFIILIKTFIEQLPASLEESAALDGAGFLTLFLKIIFPLSKPIIATIAVYAAVGNWNSWQDNYFLVSNPKLQTMQMILYNYLNQAQQLADNMRIMGAGNTSSVEVLTPNGIRMATTVITVIPIILVYPFLQRYFVKGIMIGAIKG